ncbi:tyrosine-type recombinase/integrase [Sediminicola luteus]|uniref:Tyrosine recombinase XerC n=1 Tax=Sediminicola luteus TaxID=319238 RepID=A0A2A4G6Z6_9FLAO|nr:tyrosine-type recombinase/integrase [Sediminicola luteus]PCE63512.1 integrase [Sediminicola luteus]
MALDAFLDYLKVERNYSKHTLEAYGKDLSDFTGFCEQGDGVLVAAAQYIHIRSWIVALSQQGVSNRSINRKVSSLRAYYRFLRKIGQRTDDPLVKHRALKVAKQVEVPFSQQEMDAVLLQIDYGEGFTGARDKAMVELLYGTGMRRAELIELRLSDVDFSGRTLKVLGKRNKERLIPILDTLSQTLSEYLKYRNQLATLEANEYFFLLESGKKIYPNLVYRTINKYLGEVSAKVKKSPHMLRHTFATHLLAQGADINSVKELLGHAGLAATQIYTHQGIAELKKVHRSAHPRNKG